jgi:hypothetical protein
MTHNQAYTIPAHVQVTICPPGRCPGAGALQQWSRTRLLGSRLAPRLYYTTKKSKQSGKPSGRRKRSRWTG